MVVPSVTNGLIGGAVKSITAKFSGANAINTALEDTDALTYESFEREPEQAGVDYEDVYNAQYDEQFEYGSYLEDSFAEDISTGTYEEIQGVSGYDISEESITGGYAGTDRSDLGLNENYIVEGGRKTVDVKLSKKKYPESAQHIEEAIKEGQPDTLTIDRGGASARRKASLQGVDTVPGLDRDEYPPAMSMEGGSGASVKLINPSDNRGSGSSISGQLRKYPNGTKYRIIITDED